MTDYMSEAEIGAYLDQKFGKGKWKFTSDYRSPEREDQLRSEGAGTVAPGETSAHSRGKPGASGAVDLQVDGMSAGEVATALKSGPFTKEFAEGRHGGQGAHVHAEPVPELPAGFKLDSAPEVTGPVASGPSAAPDHPPLPPGFTLDAHPTLQPPADKPKPTPLQQASLADQVIGGVSSQLGQLGSDIGARVGPAQRQLAQDIAPTPPNSLKEAVTQGIRAGGGPITLAGDALGEVGGLVTGLLDWGVGRPTAGALDPAVKAATGGRYEIDPQKVGDVASLAIPGAGEAAEGATLARRAEAAGVLPATLKASDAAVPAKSSNTLAALAKPASNDPDHAAAVKRLEAAGVTPAQHQRIGGQVQRFAESAKADPYVGSGIRSSEDQALDSYNRALYNKVLGPIGERAPATLKPGRAGVKYVKDALSSAYQSVLPYVKATGDDQLTDDLAQTRTAVAKLGEPQAKQYEAILNQDVLHHFGPEGMDGKTYKSVVSDLLRQARGFKGSQDPNQRGLGYALEDTVSALQSDMIRSSPQKYADKLKDINQSYALYARLRDAATVRKGGGGDITPGDLLSAVRRGDKSVGKGDFATGDALLQDFAEDGDKVLSPRHGTSHTPEIQNTVNMLRGRGAVGGALGGAMGYAHGGGPEGAAAGAAIGGLADVGLARGANALARQMLTARRAPATGNALKAVTQQPSIAQLAIKAGWTPQAATALQQRFEAQHPGQ